MNFNMSQKPDYALQGRLTNELINLYGIELKLLITEKIKYDKNVFGDYSSIKIDKDRVFKLMGLPENTEEWDDYTSNFSDFGLFNTENIRLFVSAKDINEIFPEDQIKNLQSNLIILPNNRLMEITEVNFQVPGINNLFVYSDDKHVYKLTLKTYDVKITDEIVDLNDTDNNTSETYDELQKYFDELTSKDDEVKDEALNKIDPKTQKTTIEIPEDPVFGRF